MAGHAQLKFVMTEYSKTQIRLTGPISKWNQIELSSNGNGSFFHFMYITHILHEVHFANISMLIFLI